ncbi:MAG: hypothetical protein M3X11_06025 [Acidobacteriota bacterium]|nr:hypothetical protein [Acidobacteriota bacterium]
MSKFDDELRLALRREEPSPDFTNRVMARIQAMEQLPVINKQQEKLREENNWRQRLADLFRPPTIKWAMASAMAVVLIAAIFGVNRYREHQRQMAEIAANAANAEGQRAKEQVMLAMRIASAKLNVAQRKVKEAGQRDENHPQTEHQ